MLHRLLQISAGDRLLYVGDHMYADILRSKRTLGWRTCLIVPELTGEIMAYKRHKEERTEVLALRREQFLLENTEISNDDEEANKTLTRLKVLRGEIRDKLGKYNRVFHPKWGPLFRAGFQESRFALQVIPPSFPSFLASPSSFIFSLFYPILSPPYILLPPLPLPLPPHVTYHNFVLTIDHGLCVHISISRFSLSFSSFFSPPLTLSTPTIPPPSPLSPLPTSHLNISHSPSHYPHYTPLDNGLCVHVHISRF